MDTGVPLQLSAEGSRRWDFGDGSPAVEGTTITHAFQKAGRFEVKAFDGERLTDRITVLVQPRQPFHAIAPKAEAALVFRSLDDLPPAIDFIERIGSAATVQRLLDAVPVLQFLLEPGPTGRAALDRSEGAGAFLPSGADAMVTFFGVTDPSAGEAALLEFLVERGWRPADAPATLESRGRLGRLLVDRGTVFFILASDHQQLAVAEREVRSAPNLGLEADPPTADAISELASGGVALIVRPRAAEHAGALMKRGAWSMALAAIEFKALNARVVGRFLAPAPLWKTPAPSTGKRLLTQTPEGVVAAAALNVPLAEVLTALGISLDDGEDEEVAAALSVLSRRLDLSLYFDVEEFLRATVKQGGRPAPRVTLLAETETPERMLIKRVLDRVLARRNAPYDTVEEKGVTRWKTTLEQQPLALSLGQDTLSATWGRPITGAENVDLVALLTRRAEGACGPGHLSAFVDVGQLGRQLLEPRMVPGLDPRMVVVTQALTATFVTQATALDQIVFDLAPAPRGATFFVEVKLSKRDGQE